MNYMLTALEDLQTRKVQGLVQYRISPCCWVGPAEASVYLAYNQPQPQPQPPTEKREPKGVKS